MAAIAPPSPSPSPVADAGRSDGRSEPSGNAGGAPAWNKPAGGRGPGGEAESSLLGSGAWPALSDSARASSSSPSKSSPESPAEDLADGLSELSVSKGTESNIVETPNHIAPARQRSMRRNGMSPGPFDSRQTNPASRNAHQQPRSSSFRNRSGGQHIRATDFHQHRGNQEWHSPQVGGFDPRFMRPMPPFPLPIPFPHPYHPLPPQQAFSLGNPLVYPEMAPRFFPTLSPDIQAGGPIPVLPYSPLHFEILRQIEYYFSKDNLIKDLHFRKEWNGQGWVHISIIAAFKKVSSMTRDINLILDAIRTSTMLEIQGEMVRKRDDWERWLVPKDFKFSSDRSAPNQ
ncbi:la-related protein 1C-like isoform X2 [Rhodamnia argentea]|uniref:La-related protein 1C-like isoform X2 n=1 Tax=Rhodamnia argentea TaxID=178133 RepID=A0ABM3HT63_9MYRT|nr:la-related protein 1C-like isoform X2 [Rhodamnia argentea]